MTDAVVHPRGVWAALLIAIAGSVVLGVAVLAGSWVVAVPGGVLLAGAAALGWASGGMYDVGTGGVAQEFEDVAEGGTREGVEPGEMVSDPEARQTSRRLAARRRRILRERRAAARPPLAPLGAGALLGLSIVLLVAQWEIYVPGRTSQDNATRVLGLAVVAGVAGLCCRLPGRHPVAAGSAILAGLGLVLGGLLADHVAVAAPALELGSGVLAIAAALLVLGSPLPARGS